MTLCGKPLIARSTERTRLRAAVSVHKYFGCGLVSFCLAPEAEYNPIERLRCSIILRRRKIRATDVSRYALYFGVAIGSRNNFVRELCLRARCRAMYFLQSTILKLLNAAPVAIRYFKRMIFQRRIHDHLISCYSRLDPVSHRPRHSPDCQSPARGMTRAERNWVESMLYIGYYWSKVSGSERFAAEIGKFSTYLLRRAASTRSVPFAAPQFVHNSRAVHF